MIACDLGSNTFRVVEIDCKSKERVREFERIVKTADGLAQSGKISFKAQQRIIEAINEAKDMFDLKDAYCVTTAALRIASNSDEVLKNIKDATGLEFKIIDSAKEAKYAKIAVENRLEILNIKPDDYVIMDLGGGSTELIFKEFDKSFDIGIVTIVDNYSLTDIKNGIKKEFKEIEIFANSVEKPQTFIATAGTPTTIAAYLQGMDYSNYDYKKVNGTILSLKDMENALEKLLSLPESDRSRWVGVGRDNLIIAGILMFKEIVEIFGFDEVLIIDDGVREGVALNRCT